MLRSAELRMVVIMLRPIMGMGVAGRHMGRIGLGFIVPSPAAVIRSAFSGVPEVRPSPWRHRLTQPGDFQTDDRGRDAQADGALLWRSPVAM